MTKPLLTIKDLSVLLPEGADRTFAIKDVNLTLKAGETLCVVGESGSGKSLTAKAIMGLLPAPHVKVNSGSIDFEDEDLVKVSYERLRQIRGSEISMIFREFCIFSLNYSKICHFSSKFYRNFQSEAVQKRIHRVDFEKCCKMSISTLKSASIQP